MRHTEILKSLTITRLWLLVYNAVGVHKPEIYSSGKPRARMPGLKNASKEATAGAGCQLLARRNMTNFLTDGVIANGS